MEVFQTVPILRIFDVAKAKEFYLDYLGFRTDWEHRFEPGLYMQISKGGCGSAEKATATSFRAWRPRRGTQD